MITISYLRRNTVRHAEHHLKLGQRVLQLAILTTGGPIIAKHIPGQGALEGDREARLRSGREGGVEGEDPALVFLVELAGLRVLDALQRVRLERRAAELEAGGVEDDLGGLLDDLQAVPDLSRCILGLCGGLLTRHGRCPRKCCCRGRSIR